MKAAKIIVYAAFSLKNTLPAQLLVKSYASGLSASEGKKSIPLNHRYNSVNEFGYCAVLALNCRYMLIMTMQACDRSDNQI